MFRLMQPSDLAAMKELWVQQRKETAQTAENAIVTLAGMQNSYLAEEDGKVCALVLAVPVVLQSHSGSYLYGLCSKDVNTAAGLLDYVCAQQKLQGTEFTIAALTDSTKSDFYLSRGFIQGFGLRCLTRSIRRNLWSQAEFDTVNARQLCTLRARYWPNSVLLTPEQMGVVLGDLYSRGATVVHSSKGYGVYFRRDDTLFFAELMAEDDSAAENLMEAARQKESIVEKAVITVGASTPLFWGEGQRTDCGMIRFEKGPFDISESYMSLMMEG